MFVEASREAAGRANDSAGESATSAQEAFNHASQAYSSMESAQGASAVAQKAANASLFNADRAEAVYEEMKPQAGSICKRLDNLEAGLPASAWQTDESVAYAKAVPANANPYAAITKIGGMTYKSKNLIPFPYNNLGGAGASQTKKGITATVQDDGSVVLNGTFSGTGPDDFVLIPSGFTLPAGGYTISGAPAAVNTDANRCCLFAIIKKADGTNSYTASYTTGMSFTLNDGDSFSLSIRIQPAFGTQTNIVVKPMMEPGDTATEYQPYFAGLRSSPVTSVTSSAGGTTALPTSLLSLNGYGLGVSSANCNYIDWRPAEGVKRYEQMCAESAYQSGDESLSNVVTDGSTKTVYVLDTPVTTDLSDVLSDDNLFEVEGGGSLTFDNEHQNAVHSTVLYQLKADA
jgi:hypothetical protein